MQKSPYDINIFIVNCVLRFPFKFVICARCCAISFTKQSRTYELMFIHADDENCVCFFFIYGLCTVKHITCNFKSPFTFARTRVTCFCPSSESSGIASNASSKNDFAVELLYSFRVSRINRISMLACNAPFALKR